MISASKGNLGHLIAGAALTETAIAIKSFSEGQIPAINNLSKGIVCQVDVPEGEDPDPVCNGLNYAMENIQHESIDVIVKNSLCFGGVNMSVVLKRYEERKDQAEIQ